MGRLYVYICDVCGEPFESRTPNSRWCVDCLRSGDLPADGHAESMTWQERNEADDAARAFEDRRDQ